MATENKQSIRKPAASQEPQVDKGYSGSQDHQTGQVQSDPAQATDEQIKQDRERQRGSF